MSEKSREMVPIPSKARSLKSLLTLSLGGKENIKTLLWDRESVETQIILI
jgi:hypothetical protein